MGIEPNPTFYNYLLNKKLYFQYLAMCYVNVLMFLINYPHRHCIYYFNNDSLSIFFIQGKFMRLFTMLSLIIVGDVKQFYIASVGSIFQLTTGATRLLPDNPISFTGAMRPLGIQTVLAQYEENLNLSL